MRDDVSVGTRQGPASGRRDDLVAVERVDHEVRAVAGYRVLEKLSAGRFLYVDDLVTRAGDRSRAYGGHLLDWLSDRAREENCVTLELDSGVQRHAAHRFYLRKGMDITSHHFAANLSALRRPSPRFPEPE